MQKQIDKEAKEGGNETEDDGDAPSSRARPPEENGEE